MKKILYSLLMGGLMLFAATSCKDSVEDSSVITYFVDLQLKGEKTMYVPLNTEFVEPGYTAYIQDEDVTNKVKVSGEVDITKVGYYVLTYVAVNNDGYTSKDTRKVFVYDGAVSDDIDYSGKYQTSKADYTDADGEKTDYKGYFITIEKVCQGLYSVSDFYGGYYSQFLGKGSRYAFTGYAYINASNELSCAYPELSDDETIEGSVNASDTDESIIITLSVKSGDEKFEIELIKTE